MKNTGTVVEVCVGRAVRNTIGTFATELLTFEFRRKHRLETVGNGIDPVNPEEPRMHVWVGNLVTTIDDVTNEEDTGYLGGCVEIGTSGTTETEETVHT